MKPCPCGCGAEVKGRATVAGASCRKRMQRRRERGPDYSGLVLTVEPPHGGVRYYEARIGDSAYCAACPWRAAHAALWFTLNPSAGLDWPRVDDLGVTPRLAMAFLSVTEVAA